MNSERQQAYLNLINQLLNCPSGEEAEVLKTHPELLDDGLVVAMLEEADNLREKGQLNNANWLMNFAGVLFGMNDNTSVAVTREPEAERLLEQGNQQFNISQFREALQSWEQALTIYREIGSREGEANSLGNFGTAYNSLGQFYKAIEFLEQSLEISRKIGDRLAEANSLDNLGISYYSLGQYHEAIKFYQKSLKISREIGDCQGKANSLGNLGNTYQALGEYDRAIEFYQKSLKISREIGDRQQEAMSLGNLGNAYNYLGQYRRAIEFIEQQLEISLEIQDRQGEAMSLGNLGNAYQYLGQYHMAIEFHEQSLLIEREIENRVGESISLNNLGKILFMINLFTEAETALRASIEICENLRYEIVKDEDKISIFETQVDVYRLLQQVLVAQCRFDEALEISEMSRTRAFVELLQQTLLTNELPANNQTNKLSIPKIQQIARDRNSTIVEYSIVNSEIYIWVIQPNGNITHRAANLEPLNQQNQTLKQIILKTRVSIGTNETDDAGNKIQLESH